MKSADQIPAGQKWTGGHIVPCFCGWRNITALPLAFWRVSLAAADI
jgi:hypothetical protein